MRGEESPYGWRRHDSNRAMGKDYYPIAMYRDGARKAFCKISLH